MPYEWDTCIDIPSILSWDHMPNYLREISLDLHRRWVCYYKGICHEALKWGKIRNWKESVNPERQISEKFRVGNQSPLIRHISEYQSINQWKMHSVQYFNSFLFLNMILFWYLNSQTWRDLYSSYKNEACRTWSSLPLILWAQFLLLDQPVARREMNWNITLLPLILDGTGFLAATLSFCRSRIGAKICEAKAHHCPVTCQRVIRILLTKSCPSINFPLLCLHCWVILFSSKLPNTLVTYWTLFLGHGVTLIGELLILGSCTQLQVCALPSAHNQTSRGGITAHARTAIWLAVNSTGMCQLPSLSVGRGVKKVAKSAWGSCRAWASNAGTIRVAWPHDLWGRGWVPPSPCGTTQT